MQIFLIKISSMEIEGILIFISSILLIAYIKINKYIFRLKKIEEKVQINIEKYFESFD